MRKRQCAKCPWKVSTNPSEIPNYQEEQHEQLCRTTIAEPGHVVVGESITMMACHSSTEQKPYPCVGWVVNQLGIGNNIALRLRALDGRFKDMRTVGPQHERIEDTLPRRKRR